MVCVNKIRNTSTPATATAVAHLVSRVILSARHMQSFCITVHICNSTLSVRKMRRTILVAQGSSGLISQIGCENVVLQFDISLIYNSMQL